MFHKFIKLEVNNKKCENLFILIDFYLIRFEIIFF